MVISMEPMIMIPEGRPGAGGYREHDILVIKNGSVEYNQISFWSRSQRYKELNDR